MKCGSCGLGYDRFRTGMTFASVKQAMFDKPPDEPKSWKYKRRNGVLGFWHQMKLMLWDQHVHDCTGAKTVSEIRVRRRTV